MVKVLIVEDEPEFLRRFADAVRSNSLLTLCGAVDTVAAARTVIEATSPDVVLTDLGLPDGNGVEVIRAALGRNPLCDVLVVTMFGDDGSVIDSLSAGATGYLTKDALPKDIVTSILEIRDGGAPISPAIARRVLQHFRVAVRAPSMPHPPQAAGVATANSSLTPRETEILRLVAKGLNFKEIGGVLSLSPHTVTTHVKRIYQKLAVHSRGEAVYEASQLGLL
jgi:DNA-binding NarL/FixJ family response regulator